MTAAIPISGCSDPLLSNGAEREDDTIEIMVENRTDELAEIGVGVEHEDERMLFSRVYELEPGHLDLSAGIETTPETVTAFTPEGTSTTWEYTPDVDLDCEGKDIGITLQSDSSIDSWYACWVHSLH